MFPSEWASAVLCYSDSNAVSAGSAWRQVQTQQQEQLTGHPNNRHGATPQQQQHQQQVGDSAALPDGSGEQQQQEGATPGFGPGGAGSQWLQAVNMAALTEAQMREQQQQQQQKENGSQQTHDSWTDGHAQAMVCLMMPVCAPTLEFAIIVACCTCCIMC